MGLNNYLRLYKVQATNNSRANVIEGWNPVCGNCSPWNNKTELEGDFISVCNLIRRLLESDQSSNKVSTPGHVEGLMGRCTKPVWREATH